MIILAEDHRYIDTDTGRVYPSVTQTIRDAGLMGYMPEDDWYLERGTAVHAATALWDRGELDEDTVDPAVAPYLDAWKRYRADMRDPDIGLMIEQIVYDPIVGYAGTMDRAGIDIKTGTSCPWHIVQCAAYHYACPIRPPQWQSVYLSDDGKYKVQVYKPSELFAAFKIFSAALQLNQWRKDNWV
jgi:hypothetical protein